MQLKEGDRQSVGLNRSTSSQTQIRLSVNSHLYMFDILFLHKREKQYSNANVRFTYTTHIATQ